MTLFGWRRRTRYLESAAYVCPSCDCLRSIGSRQPQKSFAMFGIPLSPWLDAAEPTVAECEHCGFLFPSDVVLHGSLEIAAIEQSSLQQAKSEGEIDDEAEPECRPCPSCSRENSVTTRICPRCDYRF